MLLHLDIHLTFTTCHCYVPYPYQPFPVFKRIKAVYQSLVQLEAKLLDYLIPGANPRSIVAKTIAVSWVMVKSEDVYQFIDVLGVLIVTWK